MRFEIQGTPLQSEKFKEIKTFSKPYLVFTLCGGRQFQIHVRSVSPDFFRSNFSVTTSSQIIFFQLFTAIIHKCELFLSCMNRDNNFLFYLMTHEIFFIPGQ